MIVVSSQHTRHMHLPHMHIDRIVTCRLDRLFNDATTTHGTAAPNLPIDRESRLSLSSVRRLPGPPRRRSDDERKRRLPEIAKGRRGKLGGAKRSKFGARMHV